MKSSELPRKPPEGEWRPSRVVDAFSVSSARRPIPRQSGGSDSLNNSPPGQDHTRGFLHQLSQILTSLCGTLELALLADSDAQEYRRVIQQSLAQAEGLVQLFKSYRAWAEGGTSDLVNDKIEVGKLVRVALEQLRPHSDSRRLAVHVESGDNSLVQTDPARLLMALRLGLLRAIQQSPAGGRLEVNLSTNEGSACLTISATAQQAALHSPPECAEIPERESQRVLTPDSEERDWTAVRRAVEALGGSVLLISAGTPPLICKICLPLSLQQG
jgi:signal transduction histidine kinase